MATVNKKTIKKQAKKIPVAVWLPVILCFALGVLAGYLVYGYVTKNDKFVLNGEQNVTINVGDKYTEEFVTAIHFGKDCSNDVQISGVVDTTKTGKYVISYTLNNFRYRNVVRYRYVTVVENGHGEE